MAHPSRCAGERAGNAKRSEAARSGAERSGAAVMVPGDARAARRDGEAVQRLDRNHRRGFCVAGKQHTTIISC